MKTEEFIRIRRLATHNGWNVEQQSIADSNEVVAIFTKIIDGPYSTMPPQRQVRVFFEIEEDQTIVKACFYNGSEIKRWQAWNILESI